MSNCINRFILPNSLDEIHIGLSDGYKILKVKCNIALDYIRICIECNHSYYIYNSIKHNGCYEFVISNEIDLENSIFQFYFKYGNENIVSRRYSYSDIQFYNENQRMNYSRRKLQSL